MPHTRNPFVIRLAARLGLMNLFVYLLVAGALHQSWQQYEHQATLSAQNLAQSLAINVSGTLRRVDGGVFSVAKEAERELASGGIDAASINGYIRQQHHLLPELEGMRIVDASGSVRYGEHIPPDMPLSVANRDFFQQLRANPGTDLIISDPLKSRITGDWSVVLLRRLNDPSGQFAGMAYGLLPLTYFTHLFSPLDVGAHGVIAVRDQNLRIWVRVPDYHGVGLAAGNSVVSQTTADQMHSHPEGATYIAVAKLDGVQRRLAFRPIAGQRMFIVVGLATQDYRAQWFKELGVMLALALIFTLVTLAVGVAAYRRRRAEVQAIADLHQSRDELQRSETRFRTLYDATDDAVWLRDNGRIVDCNPAAVRILGVQSREHLLNAAPDELWPVTQPDGSWSGPVGQEKMRIAFAEGSLRFEWWFRRMDNGKVFPTEVLLNALVLDGKPILQAVVRDITERKAAEEQIRHLAYFDPLTSLPNRRLLMDRLAQALHASAQSGEFGALMILDLDNFKVLNDTQGHAIGDRLLVSVAQRIQHCLREVDTVCRLGGDEYVVMLENLGNDRAQAQEQAETYAGFVRTALDQPYAVLDDEQHHHSTASIGVTLLWGADTAEHVLLKQADVALYQAKAAGRNTVRFFSPAMQEVIESRSALEAALRHSLQTSGFKLFYQPQVSLDNGLIGAEALLRWFPEDGRQVSPAQFIPVAEDSGLILPLGYWVMQTACAQLTAWAQDPATRDLKIAINVSARQFHQADYADHVRQALVQSGANPARLQLELTESVVLENVEDVVERMLQIRALGVTFSLDDFGTGFSSLSYLKQLPLDQIKIDQSFVRDVTTSTNDAAIVRAIVAIAQSLGLQVIAEGVENRAQLDFLISNGCRVCQGYLLGRPVPIEDWSAAVGDVVAGFRVA